MTRRLGFKSKKRRNNIFQLIAAVFACVILIAFNYQTIKVVSSMSAFILGESQYSKKQKDAVRQLMTYLATEEIEDYKLFQASIGVPQNTGLAFQEMASYKSDSIVHAAFQNGVFHREDIENIIWVYKGFSHYTFMKDAVRMIWQADTLVNEIVYLGHKVNQVVPLSQSEADRLTKLNFIRELNIISTKLANQEADFSILLRRVGRNAANVLFWVNTIVVLLMLATVALFSNLLINKLEKSRRELENTNAGLIATNDKLDNFIYATSHNLKAPINNLEGLLNLLGMVPATNPIEESIHAKMSASITSLTNNINKLEELMKLNSNPDANPVMIDLRELVFHVVEQHQEFIQNANITVSMDFKISKLRYAEAGINEVLVNLLSNSIKYISPDKPGEIEISTYEKEGYFVLRFADNGLGMDVSLHGDQIFGLFKRFHKKLSGSGVGLYLVKQIVERNGGKIKAQSQIGKGTAFELFLRKL